MPTARYLDQPYLLAGRRIDPITGTLSYREVQKHLRRKELEVLALLAEAGGEQVARSVFIEQVWQGNPIVGEQGLTDTISALRRSLLDTDRENPLILTIPRRGYQLRASIRSISRDGGVAFVAGTVIDGRPDWRLKQLLEQTDAHESWLAEDGRSRRIFRFCRNEQQLRKLRREVVLMRYLREALASQEHVSTILDWQLEEPPYFLELAAPACGNLRGVMLGKSVPEAGERWRLLREVAEALAAVHAAGVVHRALSPDSVLVDRRSGERVALLGEFGLAALDDRQRLAELGINAEGLSLKTALLGPATAYTAPECAAGAPASAASDVYALGVLIAQTLSGDFQQLEFSGFEMSPELAALLRECRAADPARRPTAAALAARLHEQTRPQPAAPAPAVAPAPEVAPAVAPVEVIAASPAEVAAKPAAAPPVDVTVPEAAAPSPATASLVNQRLGRYRILNELAQGGMGVVYLAEQSEPVQRRVALKLIRAGLDSEQILARFEAERQALALMNHPNIAAIFDAGSTPGGYPYFVMEFVPGKDIKSHCDDAKLSLRARIRLFLQVCDGVLHAHQKGLIHRDLKPGNILVSPKPDQAALVKLIDFGVAKSLHGGLRGGMHTVIGTFIGTPVYSCPEQVTHPTRDIDTRADLYSLGVVLYELLVGVPPRSATELNADTPAELARRLRDTKTPAMGSRYTGLSAEERQRIAELRALSSDGLSMQLCSDLDWIVGKCIAQDPDDRYATVHDLRLDLQRWLDDRPVEARPTSAWYRLRKMVRRNRLNTALISGIVIALISATTLAVLGYQRAERARADAERTARFQGEMLRSIDAAKLGANLREQFLKAAEARPRRDPASEVADTSKMIDGINFTDLSLQQLDDAILDRSLAKINEDFVDNAALRGELVHTLADVWFRLGRYPKALDAQQHAVELRRQAHGTSDRRTLESMSMLAHIRWRMGEPKEAEQLLTDTLARMQESLEDTDPLLSATRNRLASIYSESGKIAEAESLFRANLAEGISAADVSRMEALNQLGNLLTDQGKLAEGHDFLSKALDARLDALGADHPDTLNSMNDLGYTLRQMKNFAEGEKYMRMALEGYVRIAGETHPNTQSISANLATFLLTAGDLADAEIFARRTLAAREATLGTQHPRTLLTLSNLGLILNERGQAAAAEAVLVDVLERSATSNTGLDTPLYAKLRLASALRKQGKWAAATSLIDQVISDAGSLPEFGERLRLLATDERGLLMALNGQFAESEQTHREAYTGLLKISGDKDSATLSALANLNGVLFQQKKLDEARERGSTLIQSARSALPSTHYQLAVYLTQHARVLSALNEFPTTEALLHEAWGILERSEGFDPLHLHALNKEVLDLDIKRTEKQPDYRLSAEDRQWRDALSKAVRQIN